MFTGIVEEVGTLIDVTPQGADAARITIRAPLVTSDAAAGDSIAVNGVCLTVVDNAQAIFTADVMGETLRRSNLGELLPGSPVNVERAVPANGRLGGHIVQGHVDTVAQIEARESFAHWDVLRVSLPAQVASYVVEKGAITIDGVSLTVSGVTKDWFEVSLIPTTLQHTVLGGKKPGDRVNLEADVIAKYLERLANPLKKDA